MNSNNTEKAAIVKLNVGGTIHWTLRSTLTKGDTMLSEMFSGRQPLSKLPDGSLFIDRCGKHFETILNFLRDETKIVLPDCKRELIEIRNEADYYRMKELVDHCTMWLEGKSDGGLISNQMVTVFEGRNCSVSRADMSSEHHLSSKSLLPEAFNTIEAGRSARIPLNQNGTMSIRMLQMFFPGAKHVCVCSRVDCNQDPTSFSWERDQYKFSTPGEQMLDFNGVLLFPPSKGWKNIEFERNRKLFVMPFTPSKDGDTLSESSQILHKKRYNVI